VGGVLVLVLTAALVALSVSQASRPKRHKPDAIARLIKLGLPLWCGGVTRPYVALTFDDGPGPYTAPVLDLLDQFGMPATFFLVGQRVIRRPELVVREAAMGAIGNHTWDHPVLPALKPAQIHAELARTKRAIELRTNTKVRLFRPPFGQRDAVVSATARSLGMLLVMWSADSGDASEPSTPTPEKIYENLAARVRPGSIILLHENITGQPDYYALKLFLPELQRRGLIPVTIPQLLKLDPPTIDQVRAGEQGCGG
jgi:peptidoglycan/xylan/chitin deacetylase (PgdA/CDA1 family)